MVRYTSLAILLGLQPAVSQISFCRSQLSCFSCTTLDGCVWNATGLSCLEGWEFLKCAGDRTCINHPCSCSAPLYAKPFPLPDISIPPLYAYASTASAPIYASTAAPLAYPLVSTSAAPIYSTPIAPLYTSTAVAASYPIVSAETFVAPPLYSQIIAPPLYSEIIVPGSIPLYTRPDTYYYGGNGGGNGGGLNVNALILASLLGKTGGVTVPPVGPVTNPPVVVPPVVVPPVGPVTNPPYVPPVVVPPVGPVTNPPYVPPVIGKGKVHEPPAWGARYIAGTKPPLTNPGPFPLGIAANINARGGKLNNGGLLDLNAMGNFPVKGGGTLLDVGAGLGRGGNPFNNIVKADIKSNLGNLGSVLGSGGNGGGKGKGGDILNAVVTAGLLGGGSNGNNGNGGGNNGKGKGVGSSGGKGR